MKIIIYGAGGFIGSHLTTRLLKEGYFVVGVDIFQDKLKEVINHPNLVFLKKDIRLPSERTNHYLKEADLVIDLIAYANPGLYVKIPLEVFRLNFEENLKIAEACAGYNKRLIQFSTCEVYGRSIVSTTSGNLKNPEDPSYATFSEDTSPLLLGPVNKHRWIYASSKQLLERVLHAYGIEKGLNYTIIRPFNFIGPKIDYLPDETDGVPRVFSFFMDALLNGTKMKLVNGGDHRRCYTYIDDAIDCIYKIINNPESVCDQQIFNIGSPQNEISIRKLAETMRAIYAQKFRDKNIPLPKIVEVSADEFYGPGYEDSDRRIPDISKAQRLLGWNPKWELAELLETTMQYYVTDYVEQVQKRRKTGEFNHDILHKAQNCN